MRKRNKIILGATFGLGSLSVLSSGLLMTYLAMTTKNENFDELTRLRNSAYKKLKSMNVKFENSYIISAHVKGEKETNIIVQKENDSPKQYDIKQNNVFTYGLTHGFYKIWVKQGEKSFNFQFKWINKDIEIVKKIDLIESNIIMNDSNNSSLLEKNTNNSKPAQKMIDSFFTTWESKEDFQKNTSKIDAAIETSGLIVEENTLEARKLFEKIVLQPKRLKKYESNLKASTDWVVLKSFKFSYKENEVNKKFYLIRSRMEVDAVTGVSYKEMLTSEHFTVMGTTAKPATWIKEEHMMGVNIKGTSYSIIIDKWNSKNNIQKNITKILPDLLQNTLD